MSNLDPRLTPARPDLAAEKLRGEVEAERFVAGATHHARICTAIRFTPDAGAKQESQLLAGEPFTVYDVADGWAWGQAELDDYVGYVAAADLVAGEPSPTHRVDARTTHLYPAPDLKQPVVGHLGFASWVNVSDEDGGYCRTEYGWVFAKHLAPIDRPRPDPVATALQLMGVPYLWGGRSADGIDCSGLVQLSVQATGQWCPRDSDMQGAWLGEPVADLASARQGDVIGFNGHCGFLVGDQQLLHANAFDMHVGLDLLKDVMTRAGEITAIRRPSPAP
ncbi:MAG: NlpC/P60 family protein [Alphaproteobacteria bacterium]